MVSVNSSCCFCPYTRSSRSLSLAGFFYRLSTLSADRYLAKIMLGCHISFERIFQNGVKISLATGCRYKKFPFMDIKKLPFMDNKSFLLWRNLTSQLELFFEIRIRMDGDFWVICILELLGNEIDKV